MRTRMIIAIIMWAGVTLGVTNDLHIVDLINHYIPQIGITNGINSARLDYVEYLCGTQTVAVVTNEVEVLQYLTESFTYPPSEPYWSEKLPWYHYYGSNPKSRRHPDKRKYEVREVVTFYPENTNLIQGVVLQDKHLYDLFHTRVVVTESFTNKIGEAVTITKERWEITKEEYPPEELRTWGWIGAEQ